jgi:hypothetical protein
MKTMAIALLSVVVLTTMLIAQSDGMEEKDTAYPLSIVGFELKMNSGGRRVQHSWSQKRLAQLGDGASIALIKILAPSELKNPERIAEYMPVIRAAFAQPDAIALEVNKDPKVTLFLLGWVRQNVSDPAAQQLTQETEEFVRRQATR